MLRLEFWLPLPLLGLAFWLMSGLITDHSLKYSHQSVKSYEITANEALSGNKILYIKVIVNRDRNTSRVKVKQATQVYQKQEFELDSADLSQIETEIAQKLGLPAEQLSQLLRYQIKE
ncbi:hypothetical protein [Pleurocapsa sp. FMAR1]|uniref:hypothetical protein n=1 Tax=Pleurocapsa sp. FMAR1 TaxID=3040204 RepID=UPI0029C657C0|nr:hypothetical protein [Pleurocapsa sp. FMAR1]